MFSVFPKIWIASEAVLAEVIVSGCVPLLSHPLKITPDEFELLPLGFLAQPSTKIFPAPLVNETEAEPEVVVPVPSPIPQVGTDWTVGEAFAA